MLRSLLTAGFLTVSTVAMAHPGHIADIGYGHSHYGTVSAFVVIAIAAGVALKKRFYS